MLVWKRARFFLYLIIVIPLTGLALVFNARLYTGHTDTDVMPQLHFIREALDGGAGETAQSYFPEGYFFSHVLYGLSWVDVGLRQPEGTLLHQRALSEARWALARLEAPAGQATFSAALNPPYGVFYAGWSNWLRGGILKLQPPNQRDAAEVERFETAAGALAKAFDDSPTPFLQAYPGQAWPVDNVVAMASLRLHDTLLQPRFTATIDRWIQAARQKLDPATGLLPHQVETQTSEVLDGARGSSQSVIAGFLVEIDPVWGREQYGLFRKIFVTTVAGVPGVREYPAGVNRVGDVDSGPLIAGISLSATVVGMAAANVHGDSALAEPLLDAGEALGMPLQLGGSKRYALGVLPIGDAFLAWAKSSRAWISPSVSQVFTPVVQPTWRLPFQVITFVVVLLVWSPVLWRMRLKRLRVNNKKNSVNQPVSDG